jgi:hypothetical protein
LFPSSALLEESRILYRAARYVTRRQSVHSG